MPISHQSYIHKPSDYVQPVDLNLLGRVLQFKQAQYDSGVAKTQGAIDNLASLDMVKDVDKDYLNAKLMNLVNTANNMGGADFSDPNITNQIAGLSSQIYSDDKVISAVANTKKFRYLQKYYSDLKEKKPKNWNAANEWYDMNKFSSWLQDGQVGTSPLEGAGRVTPYTNYEEDWQKLFDKIAQSANITTTMDDKGQLVWRTSTQKIVSPERIWETASKLLTPNQRQQLAIEGRYTYNGLPISELTKAYDSETYAKVGKATGELEDYKSKYKGATSLEDQEAYERLMREKETEINTLLSPIRKNSEQIKENLYLNDKLKGLQARYAFSQNSVKLQLNAAEAFRQRQNLSVKEFEYRQGKDRIDQEIQMLDKGLMWYVDPLTGQRTVVRDPNAPKKGGSGSGGSEYAGLPTLENANEEQKVEFGRSMLDTRKESLIGDNQTLFREFVQQLGLKKGLSGVVISDLMDDGRLQTRVDPEMQKAAKDMMDAWNAMTRGEKINYDNLDPLFKSFVGKYQENAKEIEAIDTFYSNIDNQIKQEYGITDAQLNAYNTWQSQVQQQRAASRDGMKMQNTYWDEATGTIKTGENVVNQFVAPQGVDTKRIKEYLNNRSDRQKQLISSADVRFNLPGMTISDDKDKNLAKMISANASTMQVYDSEGKPTGKVSLNFDNIEPVQKSYSYVRSDNGDYVKQPTLTFKYKTGSGAEDFEIGKVLVNPQQGQILGFGRDVRDLTGYRLGLHVNGEVNNVNTTSGRAYDLKYDIVKYYPDQQNNESVFLRIHKGNNKISLYNLPFATPDQAIQYMETQTKYKSIDEAFNNLNNASK